MFGLAQMFSTVSPRMFKDFEIDYAARICERFGLVYYGCCDPLDRKMAEVRLIPNVRKVSMSPWTDQDLGASEIGTDYVNSLLTHAVRLPDWDTDRARMLDALEEAKQRKWILAHGVSCHSLSALGRAARLEWVDVNLVQMNPQGANLNLPSGVPAGLDPTYINWTADHVKTARANGHGIIGMKIMGEGKFTDPADREKSIRWAMQSGLPDAIVIGFKSTAEVDEAIALMNKALAEV